MRRTKEQIVRDRTAYHEAGHAAMCLIMNFRIIEVTMNPPNCRHEVPVRRNRQRALRLIQVYMAGYCAVHIHERITYVMAWLDGAGHNKPGSDAAKIRSLREEFGVSEQEEIALERETTALLRKNWSDVEDFAKRLLKHGSVIPYDDRMCLV